MAKGRAKIAICDGLAVWLLDACDGFGDPHFHAHHAIQLTVALTGAVTIESGLRTITGSAAMVAADARHRMTGAGLIAIIFVDPDGVAGRMLTSVLLAGEPLTSFDAHALRVDLAPLAQPFERLSSDDLLAAGSSALKRLAPMGPTPPGDRRIDKVLAHLRMHPEDALVAAAEAQGVFLSPERLRHLFVEQTGLPHKSYVVWWRMTRALHSYSLGLSLTEAAHAAGFADSAHLSRVFRRTFGLPATTLTRV